MFSFRLYSTGAQITAVGAALLFFASAPARSVTLGDFDRAFARVGDENEVAATDLEPMESYTLAVGESPATITFTGTDRLRCIVPAGASTGGSSWSWQAPRRSVSQRLSSSPSRGSSIRPSTEVRCISTPNTLLAASKHKGTPPYDVF